MQLRGRGAIQVRKTPGRKMLELAAVQSQTLIVWVLSREPDTIVFPSGEKATEVMEPMWAYVFSPLSSRDAAVGQVGHRT